MIKGKKLLWLDNVVAIILGLCVCDNVIYLISIGDNKIKTSVFVPIFLLGIYFLFRLKQIKLWLKIFDGFLISFALLVLISYFNQLHFFDNHADYSGRYLNGLIFFIFFLLCIRLTISLNSVRDKIILGITIGLVLNMAISLLSFAMFKMGDVISLKSFFPQSYFFVPRYGYFRAQGMFLEPSHMLAFLIAVFPIVLINIKNRPIFSLIITILFLATAYLSFSGNIFIAIFMGMLYCIFCAKEHFVGKSIWLKIILLILLILGIAITILLLKPSIINQLYSDIFKGLQNESDSSRLNNMKVGLSLMQDYLFGVGWNMSHSLIDMLNLNIQPQDFFNFGISIFIELGILGFLTYYAFTLRLIVILLLSKKSTPKSRAIAISLACILLAQMLNGYRFLSYMAVVLGLAMVEHHNIKKEIKVEKHNDFCRQF